jgi:hypothetical protein
VVIGVNGEALRCHIHQMLLRRLAGSALNLIAHIENSIGRLGMSRCGCVRFRTLRASLVISAILLLCCCLCIVVILGPDPPPPVERSNLTLTIVALPYPVTSTHLRDRYLITFCLWLLTSEHTKLQIMMPPGAFDLNSMILPTLERLFGPNRIVFAPPIETDEDR